MCFLQYREPLIWAWCGIRPRCRHVCPLVGSSWSSRQSREWEKAGHSLSSSLWWVWWQLRPMWYLLACCTWDPYSGSSRPRGSPWGETRSACSRSRGDAYVPLDMWREPWFLSQGLVLGAPCRRVTLAMDASLTGWGERSWVATLPAVCGGVAISCGTSTAWRCWQCFEHWNTFSQT